MSEVIMPAFLGAGHLAGDLRWGGGVVGTQEGGQAPTTRRQRYDRDARYAAIPARRSSAL